MLKRDAAKLAETARIEKMAEEAVGVEPKPEVEPTTEVEEPATKTVEPAPEAVEPATEAETPVEEPKEE
jgi:hypothetical protein